MALIDLVGFLCSISFLTLLQILSSQASKCHPSFPFAQSDYATSQIYLLYQPFCP